jgi:cytidyltransferase-like protein
LNRRFGIVGVGGTFDELHKGHRALLLKAFKLGDFVQIGLCTDRFARKLRKNHKIAPYKERLNELTQFLKSRGFTGRFEIILLDDPYGPAITDGKIEALVVSEETKIVARAINKMRKRNGLPSLQIIVIRMVPAENHAAISTTRIRNGEIDKEGRLLAR